MMRKNHLIAAIVVVSLVGLFVGCGDGGSSGGGGLAETTATPVAVSGTVVDGTGAGVANAKVYLVPSTAIDTSTILNAATNNKEAAPYDEPLEDLVGNSKVYTTTADGNGAWSYASIPEGNYYVWAAPPDGNTELLPGGDVCRIARASSALGATPTTIKLTGSPSDSATYVGTSQCLTCHSGQSGHKYTAHAIGIRTIGVGTSLQDTSKYATVDAGVAKYKSAAAYTSGTKLFFEDYDSTRGFDKFKVYESVTGGGTVSFNVYLWKDTADGKYKVTFVNVINGADAGSPKTYEVAMTYGGAVYKQRYLVKVSGRKGHYPFLQYQPSGSDAYYDRTRKQWRDYYGGELWNNTTKTFKDPSASKTFEGNCAACHFTGFTTWQDSGTSEWLADGVTESGGIDIDGDGNKEEVNFGCEGCHGAGSEHVAANKARFIVNPKKLTPERENQICGQCHDRITGNGTVKNEQPLNSANKMMKPGTKRSDFLANYTSRKGVASSDLWEGTDSLHSKSHHQQYTDHIKSKHYRNDRRLVTCADCHNLHGNDYPHQLAYGVGPNSQLCGRCHAEDVVDHMVNKVNTAMSGSVTACVSCHMPKTAKSGAGGYGYLMGTPTGASTDSSIVFWEDDITSHTFAVPSRFVIGKQTPGSSMSTPYTNSCGTCHAASSIANADPLEASTCGNCHVDEYNDWMASGHANLVTSVTDSTSASRGACLKCHVGQQFLKEQITGASAYSTAPSGYANKKAQTCVVCHYPHYATSMGVNQLRAVGQVKLPEGVYVDADRSRACVMCHVSRIEDEQAGAVPKWTASSSRWELTSKPHAANQSETQLGIGAVVDYSVAGLDEASIADSTHASDSFILPGKTKTERCATCHMYDNRHKFEPKVEACAQCHTTSSDWSQWGGASTPTFARPARGDYDGDGTKETIVDEYHGLTERIFGGLTDGTNSGIGSGFGFVWMGGHPYWNLGTSQAVTPDADASKAAYNYILFEHDPAAAYHNPAYAFKILRATWKMLGIKRTGNSAWTPPGDEWTDK